MSGNVKKDAKKTSGKPRRPESAHVSPGDIGRSKSGVGKGKKGRIEDKLTETESDIAFTVQLLQQRLGIDEKGMV